MIKYHIVSLTRLGPEMGITMDNCIDGDSAQILSWSGLVGCLPILHLPEILMILFVNYVMHVCRADHFRESILGKSTYWSVMVCVSEIGYAAGQMATGIPRKDCTYMSRGQYLAT